MHAYTYTVTDINESICEQPLNKTCAEGVESTVEKPVDESEDDRIPSLLKWIPLRELFDDCYLVEAYEQAVYFVMEEPVILQDAANWQATLRVFSVWDQTKQIVTFKLKK